MQITTSAARLAAWLAFCAFAATACVYHMPIQQGNYPDAAALTQVRTGMTRAQVRYLLGTPIVPGAFDNDRWDYDYYLKAGNGVAARQARATVYFHNDLVDRIDSDVKPAPAGPATPEPAPAPAPAPAT
jgi:outer membrane protein assembly factor BamE